MKLDFSDACLILAALRIVGGAYLVFPPLALIVAGLLVAGFGLLVSRATDNQKGR